MFLSFHLPFAGYDVDMHKNRACNYAFCSIFRSWDFGSGVSSTGKDGCEA